MLLHLPDTFTYRVIFLRRSLPEIIASQRMMLIRRGEDPEKVSQEELASIGAVGLALYTLDKERAACLKTFLGYVVGGSLILVAAEILTEALAGEPRAQEVVKLVVTGSVAPLFWLQVVVGMVIPLLLVLGKSVSRTQALIAGALAILGVLLEKTWLLAAGQAQPWLDLPTGTYAPTWVEIVGGWWAWWRWVPYCTWWACS